MRNVSLLKITLAAVVTLVFGVSASAQQLLKDHMGRPYQDKQYVDVQGSPFLYSDWQQGAVTLKSGVSYEVPKLKYDQVKDELLFLSDGGNEHTFADPVAEFVLNKRVFRNGYLAADGTSPATYYEVLVDGPAQLLKRTSKNVYEEATYSSATKVKSIMSNEAFYLSANASSAPVKLRKDKKAIVNALSDKKTELEKYIKDERLDLKQEADMAKLVTYYNSL